MLTYNYDVAIIGGGPAGLSAAAAAAQAGAGSVAVIERDKEPGGILQQCIHNGFGLHLFNEELTGPAYAERCWRMVKDLPAVDFFADSMALTVTADKTVQVSSPCGFMTFKAKSLVLAMGCRERTRGAIRVPGSRPAGVFTAGAAQRMVNMEGVLPGRRVVILGSGDIGLIMARRLTLEGAQVLACLEAAPYSGGLYRNIVQCLEDYDIPLYLSHTIARIHGKERVSGVTCVQVDSALRPITGSEFYLECDTVLFSVGLIPENELTRQLGLSLDPATNGPTVDQNRQTVIPGIFAAGNVLHVHDLADFASEEAALAGRAAALYADGKLPEGGFPIPIKIGYGLRMVVPQRLFMPNGAVKLFIRVSQPTERVSLEAVSGGNLIAARELPVARPGEMLEMTLSGREIANIHDYLKLQLTNR